MRYFLNRPLFLTWSWGVLLYFTLTGLGVWPVLAFCSAIVGFVFTSLYLYRAIKFINENMRR